MESKNVSTLRAAHEAFSAHDFDKAVAMMPATVKVIDYSRGMTMSLRV